MTSRLFTFLIMCVLSAGVARLQGAEGQGLQCSGSLYADIGAFHYLSANRMDSAVFSGLSVFDIKCLNVNRARAKVEGDLEVVLPYGAAARYFAPAPGSAATDSLSWKNRTLATLGGGSFPLLLNLRKLYLEAYLPFVDIAAGRQILNFGKGRIFSPIDAFSAVELTDLNFRRNGSDVASARIPLGDVSGIDCIAEAPSEERDHSSAVKFFATRAGWDMSMVGIYRHRSREAIAGFAFKGDAVVGIYGEAVEHMIKDFDNQYFECMMGADYSIHTTWFVNAEYYYNDRPEAVSGLWGRNNAYASVQFAPNELMRFSLIGLQQFEARRTIGMLSWYYNMLQNADLTVYLRGFDNMHIFGAPDVQYAARVEVKF